ncbi:nicotinate-nucleotide adenylyltransferase [Marinobacter sp. 1Y8]
MHVILGGTFDPIHHAHLRTAIEVRERLGAEQVALVPCHLPPHRAEPGATSEQRLAMLEAAIADEPGLVVDDRELARNKPSYTVDTLAALRKTLGETIPLVMIVGTDAFAAIDRWHDWQRLLTLAHIVVVDRPGAEVPADSVAGALLVERATKDPKTLHSAAAGIIWPVSLPPLDISATGVRRSIREKGSIRYLVPDPVISIIRQSDLYRG